MAGRHSHSERRSVLDSILELTYNLSRQGFLGLVQGRDRPRRKVVSVLARVTTSALASSRFDAETIRAYQRSAFSTGRHGFCDEWETIGKRDGVLTITTCYDNTNTLPQTSALRSTYLSLVVPSSCNHTIMMLVRYRTAMDRD
jgi:hypothetical protein